MKKINEPCAVEPCTEPYYGRGFCKRHYAADRAIRLKARLNQQSRDYYAAHKEEIAERNRNYRSSEVGKEVVRRGARVRRSRKYGGGRAHYKEADVLQLYGAVCHICLEDIDLAAPRRTGLDGWERGLHFDHLDTLASGGDDSIENVRPAHGICNLTRRKPRKKGGTQNGS